MNNHFQTGVTGARGNTDELADRLSQTLGLKPLFGTRILVPGGEALRVARQSDDRKTSLSDADQDKLFEEADEEDVPGGGGRGEAIQPEPAPKKSPAFRSNSKRPFRRCVRVFSPDAIARIEQRMQSNGTEFKRRVEKNVKDIKKFDGYRRLPEFRGVGKKLADLQASFGNFGEVIRHIENEMLLAAACKTESFRFAPVLLDGPPGVGKTAFAQKIADLLGLPFRKISAGGMQHGMQLTGSASHWGNSHPGDVFNLLSTSEWASGVLLIDEADKLSDRLGYSILPALLDLLEPVSARDFVDESLGLSFDASRLIVMMTSNEKSRMYDALLSRCRVFEVGEPGLAQKKLIALCEHISLNRAMPSKRRIALNQEAVERLAASAIDTRALIMSVRQGFTEAMRSGSKVSVPEAPRKMEAPRQIGFVQTR